MIDDARRVKRLIIAIILAASFPHVARAHHEAIFGPQSSLFLSARGYVSAQAFSRRLGRAARTQESTALVSAGVSPFAKVPFSVGAILPASWIDGPGDSVTGIEDAIIGARYRLDLDDLTTRLGGEGNFLMASAAVEVPTGNVDHALFDGPVDYMTAALASLERPPFSAIAYVFYRRNGADGAVRTGDSFFTGGGLAYTPWDDPATERLVSFQLGASYEMYFRDRVDGIPQETGGRGILVHPTFVWGTGGGVLLFALVTLPLTQRYRSDDQEERWRVGTGVILLLGH